MILQPAHLPEGHPVWMRPTGMQIIDLGDPPTGVQIIDLDDPPAGVQIIDLGDQLRWSAILCRAAHFA